MNKPDPSFAVAMDKLTIAAQQWEGCEKLLHQGEIDDTTEKKVKNAQVRLARALDGAQVALFSATKDEQNSDVFQEAFIYYSNCMGVYFAILFGIHATRAQLLGHKERVMERVLREAYLLQNKAEEKMVKAASKSQG